MRGRADNDRSRTERVAGRADRCSVERRLTDGLIAPNAGAVERARAALDAYARAAGLRIPADTAALVGLLADLHHYADDAGLSHGLAVVDAALKYEQDGGAKPHPRGCECRGCRLQDDLYAAWYGDDEG